MNRPDNELLRQMFSVHLFGTSLGASHFFLVFLVLLGISTPTIADDTVVVTVTHSDFRTAHDGLIEAIESEGLVVGNTLPFRDMLARTAVGGGAIPYGEAEIIQFCSSVLAAELVREDPRQLTLCPLSVALYSLVEKPTEIHLAYRSPGGSTAGRRRAESLLQRIVRRAAGLARLHW
ncbi:MAG: DUF302 domain-containing protein [Betaproteobacteria bacterium HGW-Betaproteobacteria-6]|nr:MAG: DUF302 domain-containing protein [Betaproteobacteria bacterium HGW-Betaproteobacteria-6]